LATRLKYRAIQESGDLIGRASDLARRLAAIGPTSRRARAFGSFGAGTLVCHPLDSLVNPQAIHLGDGTLVAAHAVLSAGWMPDQPDLAERVLEIGDRCLIGRGSSLVAHRSIVVGDDVWTGHGVHVTDMNHGYERVDVPIAQQWMGEDPVRIGDGAWLGHGTVVLPGATIGRHCVVGANSVVVGDLPDFTVAVGAPARAIRRYEPDVGWIAVGDDAPTGADLDLRLGGSFSRAGRPAPGTVSA
jgi:acetyltransferase-like isoleucine patch superfamily enzyme